MSISLQQQIGSRIKALRRLKAYTQAELAELTETSTNYVGYIERGERTVSLQTLGRIAHTLGVEIGAFFLFSGREKSGRSRQLDRKAKLIGKFAAFLKNADGEDVRMLFKFAKRLTRERTHATGRLGHGKGRRF